MGFWVWEFLGFGRFAGFGGLGAFRVSGLRRLWVMSGSGDLGFRRFRATGLYRGFGS